MTMTLTLRTIALGLLSVVCGVAQAIPPAADGGQGLLTPPHDHMSVRLETTLVRAAAEGEALLRARGEWQEADLGKAAKLGGMNWPTGPIPGIGAQWTGISNFVDHDAAWPNRVLDYTCGTRTYDTSGGYNHAGVDIFLWPFGWHVMDHGSIDVRAAAEGVLLAKQDGNPDRSCSFDAPDTPNYVLIRHADGTVARYLHLQTGSVTSKAIGATISVGEVLGRVGSSGVSTGPHLHFELRANSNASAAVIDPFHGDCNAVASAWANQRPYRDSQLNRLSTHSAPPQTASCPNTTDTPNFQDQFRPGDRAVFLAAYRDQRKGQLTQYRIRRPDQSILSQWTHDLASQSNAPEAYNASYWYWTLTLPANAPSGVWTFEADFEGQTQRHTFRVDALAAITPVNDPRGLIGAWFDPAKSGQGMEMHWLEGDLLAVFFFGYRDSGANLFLLGTHVGRLNFNEPLTIPLEAASGGRFNFFDPDAVVRSHWGELHLTLHHCSQATAELIGADGQQVLLLERLGRSPGLDCD